MLKLYGLNIKIKESVYEPEEDTFLLISALEKQDLSGKTCLEIGTGTGIISMVLAKAAKKVVATDINKIALECAKQNAKLNNINNIEFITSDLFQNVNDTFDIILFNPPYLPDDPLTKDIALDGGPDGRKVIERFLKTAPSFLNKGGKVFILESSLSNYIKTIEYFEKKGFDPKIVAQKRLSWEELVVITASKTL